MGGLRKSAQSTYAASGGIAAPGISVLQGGEDVKDVVTIVGRLRQMSTDVCWTPSPSAWRNRHHGAGEPLLV